MVVAQQMPAEVSEPLMQMLRWLAWFMLAACLSVIVLAGGRLGWAWRNGALSEIGSAVWVAVLCAIVISSAASIALAVT
jgi:hypothetical protein